MNVESRRAAAPPFAGFYLAIWALAGVVAYALDRPHGALAAGLAVIAAGAYELTPVKRHFRRRCREEAGSGLGFGLCCVGSSIGLIAMLVALDVMSLFWMSVVAVLASAQKLLPAKAAIDVPLALAIVGLGFVIVFAPSLVPGLVPPAMLRQETDRTKLRRQAMTGHKTGTREEWLAARLELLEAEKELTRRGDEVARRRQELPWVRVDKDYRFETDQGPASLADLFRGRSQLLVYHFMFGPDYTAGCPSCSAIADGFNGSAAHLAGHDVTLCAVSRAPFAKLDAYRRRMGWSFPWASSYGSDFNFDFGVAHTIQEWEAGVVAYNFGHEDLRPAADRAGALDAFSESIVGTNWETYRREGPGMSAFARQDGTVYHTYSTYARGLDVLWGMYQWLDRAPLGRNEAGMWWRRHDEYDNP